MSADSEAIEEIDGRIRAVRDNLRELIDRASGYSGAADDELSAQRIAEQEAELERLKNRRTLLGGGDVPREVWEAQRAVCFTETPLEYCHLMVQEIEGRRFRFGPYGIAVTKRIGRALGVNPVWYLDITPGHDWLTENVNALIAAFIRDGCRDTNLPALLPFVEQMGTGHRRVDGERYVKEFWWEREWRKAGAFSLDAGSFICLCPEQEIAHFEDVLLITGHEASCIDPRWSLEKIIAKLAGFATDEIDLP